MIHKDNCYNVGTYSEAKKIIIKSINKKITPTIFISYNLVSGFGVECVKSLKSLLLKLFKKNKFKLFVDANNDYGLAIELISTDIQYIKLKASPIILEKINQIAKKNNVLLNPAFNIVDLSNKRKSK